MPTDDRPGTGPRPVASALVVMSLCWITALLLIAPWRASPVALGLTLALVAANLVAVLITLVRRKRLLVALSVVQIALFTLVHYQIYQALGPEHYRCDRPPSGWDWPAFTAAHVLHAADLLDVLEEYGVDLQTIRHRSGLAGGLLVALHLGADIFLLALGLRGLRRLWRRRREQQAARAQQLRERLYDDETVRSAWEKWAAEPGHIHLDDWLNQPSEEERRSLARWRLAHRVALAGCLIALFGLAVAQRWHAADWLLWPLDQVLRVIDVGDAMQIFHWQLHGVPHHFGEQTLAVAFRLTMGVWALRWLNRLHLRALGSAALRTVDDYVEALAEGDAPTRVAAAQALGQTGPSGAEAVPALAERLRDADPAVRQAALEALEGLGEVAVPGLAERLHARRQADSRAAAEALARIGHDAIAAAPDLIERLADESAAVRVAATHSLRQLGPEVVPVLIEFMTRRRSPVRWAALQLLRELSPAWAQSPEGRVACRDLVEQLADEVRAVRAQAAEALGHFGPAAVQAIPFLARRLADEVAAVRGRAAWALGRVGGDARRAAPDLVARLADPIAAVRCASAEALGRIRAEPRRCAAELARLLTDPDDDVRQAAAAALDVIDPAWRLTHSNGAASPNATTAADG